MKRYGYILLSLLWQATSATAQKTLSPDPQKSAPGKVTLNVDPCKMLGTIGDLVDGAFDRQKNETLRSR
jgi:hypothetical protein